LPAQRALEADLEEKTNQKQVGDLVERLFQLARPRAGPHQHADEERSEIGFQSDDIEKPRPDDEGEEEPAEREQFPVPGAVHDLAEERTGEEKHDEAGMQRGAAPDLGTHQAAHLQLQTDAEQQQGGSEIGDGPERFASLFSQSLADEARDEESDEGRETELSRHQTEEEGDGDEQDIHGDGWVGPVLESPIPAQGSTGFKRVFPSSESG
jgi:hypothetical protein